MSDTLEFWNSVINNYFTKGPQSFNPMDIDPYKERFFRTRNSLYHIDFEGTIFGRPDVDFTKASLIGGIEPATYAEEYHRRGWCCRPPRGISTDEVVDLIISHGRIAREGDVLAVVIDPRDVYCGKKPWLITTNVQKIIETSELPVC
jgi:hypothetical protein